MAGTPLKKKENHRNMVVLWGLMVFNPLVNVDKKPWKDKSHHFNIEKITKYISTAMFSK